jgi:hypothetical protein
VSQAVDTVAVILVTHFYAHALPIPAGLPNDELFQKLMMFIITGYIFKLVIALFDTIPFYILTALLKRYLDFDPMAEQAE